MFYLTGVTSDMSTALTTGFSQVQSDVSEIVTTALPYALGVMAIGLAITIGLKIFSRITKKG